VSHGRGHLWQAYRSVAKGKERVAAAPGKYFENRVYGEHERRTQVLYLSNVAFSKIGLPTLGSTSLGHYATKVTAVIYKWLSGRFWWPACSAW